MMSKVLTGWNFPINDDGEDDLLNQPGVEDFKDDAVVSLAREICQNSLDARDKSQQAPVEVEFSFVTLKPEQFPGHQDYKKRLEACQAYQPDSQKTQALFQKALDVVSKPVIPFLFVSDYNTTGCRGVGEKDSEWYKLTKAVGSSEKADGLGSFGIGKFAPFANSSLRTVFYSTKNIDGGFGFQGVARLISHNWKGRVTRGTGYFGLTEKNSPLVDAARIPDPFRRKNPGTTIAIAGFPAGAKWELEIIDAVLESFFYAIHSEKLVVKVGGKLVNKANLGKWMGDLENSKRRPDAKAHHYLKALISPKAETFQNEDFRGKGRITLRLITGREFPKRVAMVRDSGMKIFDKAQFQTAMKFAGVFNAEGEKINRYLKSLEPQQHDKFSPKRADDPAEAEALLRALNAWINQCVREVAERQFSSEADIEGVSKFLPDDAEDVKKPEDMREVFDDGEVATSIPMYERVPQTLPKRVEVPAFDALPDDIDRPADLPENEDLEPGPPNPNPPVPNEGVSGGITPGSGGARGAGPGPKSQPSGSPLVSLKASRSYGLNRANSSLQVSFTPISSARGYLALIAKGETLESSVRIKKARLALTGADILVSADGRVGPFEMTAGTKYQIEVDLEKPSRFAMEVIVYVDN